MTIEAKKCQLQKMEALAAIDGLTIGDVLEFFGSKATDLEKTIADNAPQGDEEFEVDYPIVSMGTESFLTGAYVLGWRWVEFDPASYLSAMETSTSANS